VVGPGPFDAKSKEKLSDKKRDEYCEQASTQLRYDNNSLNTFVDYIT
jgi:hypothetical protein